MFPVLATLLDPLSNPPTILLFGQQRLRRVRDETSS